MQEKSIRAYCKAAARGLSVLGRLYGGFGSGAPKPGREGSGEKGSSSWGGTRSACPGKDANETFSLAIAERSADTMT